MSRRADIGPEEAGLAASEHADLDALARSIGMHGEPYNAEHMTCVAR